LAGNSEAAERLGASDHHAKQRYCAENAESSRICGRHLVPPGFAVLPEILGEFEECSAVDRHRSEHVELGGLPQRFYRSWHAISGPTWAAEATQAKITLENFDGYINVDISAVLKRFRKLLLGTAASGFTCRNKWSATSYTAAAKARRHGVTPPTGWVHRCLLPYDYFMRFGLALTFNPRTYHTPGELHAALFSCFMIALIAAVFGFEALPLSCSRLLKILSVIFLLQ
jgi:uncharacterized membrane protein YtjA (UPF0391 family)